MFKKSNESERQVILTSKITEPSGQIKKNAKLLFQSDSSLNEFKTFLLLTLKNKRENKTKNNNKVKETF